jgi:hypothetical protein
VLLLPQHRGGRISHDLKQAGFHVRELVDGEWVQLSDRVRILCQTDWNQDAALIIGFGDDCGVLNLNDGSALGHRQRLARQFAPFRRRFVLRLVNYGDADMMNFFTEDGERIKPIAAEKKQLGYVYNALLKQWHGTHTAPFSCHHQFARTDSQWAAAYETPLEDHGRGFNASLGQFIPGYFRYDVVHDRIDEAPMQPLPREFAAPETFGDDWSEPLERDDVRLLSNYFSRFAHLKQRFEFIRFRVGGAEQEIRLGGPRGRGITFEAPRHSLMTAVGYEVFDDMLIGNFMKTTLHGGLRSLYPDFTPYVAKYGDNGRAFSADELQDYFSGYRGACGLAGWVDQIRIESSCRLRNLLAANRNLYFATRRVYRFLRG